MPNLLEKFTKGLLLVVGVIALLKANDESIVKKKKYMNFRIGPFILSPYHYSQNPVGENLTIFQSKMK